MDHAATLSRILSAQLGDAYPPSYFASDTRLLGNVPELDSMAVVGILTAVEEEFGIEIADDDVGADDFATFATLLAFVRSKDPAR